MNFGRRGRGFTELPLAAKPPFGLRKPMRWFILFCALSLTFLAGQLSAREWRFDVHVAGIRFGEMAVTETITGARYRVDVQAEAQGFLGLIIRSQYDGDAEGLLNARGMTSTHFYARSQRVFKDRRTDIAYLGGVPATVSITPDRERTDWSDPARVTSARLDPLSYLRALLAPGAGACPAAIPLYDGRRQTRVSFGSPSQSDNGITCTGQYEITDGPDHSIQSGRSFPVEIVYSRGGDPMSITVRAGSTSVILTPATP